MMKSKYQCPLCARYVCPKCSSNELLIDTANARKSIHDINSNVNSSSSTGIGVNVCDTCYDLVHKGKNKIKFKTIIENSENDKVSILQKALSIYAIDIKSKVNKVQSLVEFIDNMHTDKTSLSIKEGVSLCNQLSSIFPQFEKLLISINTLASVNNESKRYYVLLNNIKTTYSTILQDYMPQYRLYSKQLNTLASMPKSLAKLDSTNNNTISSSSTLNSPPISINVIHPTVLPLKGGPLNVGGSNFSAAMQVFIGKNKVKFDWISAEDIIIVAPPNKEGSASIKLVSLDGSFIEEKDVLYYSSQLSSETISTITTSKKEVKGDISMINPAASILEGGVSMQLICSGMSASNSIKLKIDKVDVLPLIIKEIKEGTSIEFKSPELSTEGFKSVEIISDKGIKAYLEHGIYYYEDNSNSKFTSSTRSWGKR